MTNETRRSLPRKKAKQTRPEKISGFCCGKQRFAFRDKFSIVICAPIYSNYHGIATQILVGIEEGLKHESSIYCDDLISLPKSVLTNFIGSLSEQKIKELNQALKIALEIE